MYANAAVVSREGPEGALRPRGICRDFTIGRLGRILHVNGERGDGIAHVARAAWLALPRKSGTRNTNE